MNLELIGVLVRLRYKLLWANTRTRNGKIALFFAGYLLLVMLISLLEAGGVGTGMVAIKSGKGTPIAAGLLTGIFAQALLASVILGLGMTMIFSETELRRYPLRAVERRLTRHFIGLLDPFWILFFVLDLALAIGLYLFGTGDLGFALVAVLLLFVCNYVAARVIAMLVQRLTAKKFGSMVMLAGVMCLGFLPALLQSAVKKSPALGKQLVHIWWATPPAAAGVAMTQTTGAARALGVIALWTLALAVGLLLLERAPQKTAARQSSKLVWESRADRLASVFGPRNGPLVGHWLRFYFRNNRFRTIYPLALPLTAFLMFFMTSRAKAGNSFAIALGVFGVLGFIGTGQFAVNQFGYVGGGFRRFLLLPTDAAAAFRAGSYMFVSLSGALIVPAAILWTLFAPIPTNARTLATLVGCSVTVLFFFHGVALWTSLFGARRGNFSHALGNDLSFAGNVAVMGTALVCLVGPQAFGKQLTSVVTHDYWWTTPLLAVVAVGFYVVSLRLATPMFRKRREYLMALMEGKG